MAKDKRKRNSDKEDTVSYPAKSQITSPDNRPLKPTTHVLILIGIAVITWFFLQGDLDNMLGAWDDIPYIRDNVLVKDISWEGVKHIFSTPSMGNYHPFTILSYAIEYSFVQLEPWQYHFDTLLLHISCTVLVYWFVFLLCRRPMVAVITALLFALHPMHVESVAWASGRKDVLYGLFYMAACICYMYYLRTNQNKKWVFYGGVIVFFVSSLLSKPVAVTLPLTLLLIDYFEKRPLVKGIFVEKIPHILLSVIFGIIAIKVQRTAGAMDMQKVHFNVMERIALGGYAFTTYLWKALVPAGLHCLYIYPAKTSGSISYWYCLYPVAIGVLIFLAWKYFRKNRVIVFGAFFLLVNIALLLQFIPVGNAIIAERYSYIPYLGLFFIVGWFVADRFEKGKGKTMRYGVLAGTVFYIGCLGLQSADRGKVWYDDLSLWRDEIEKEPKRAFQAYTNLGYIYYGKWMQEPASDEKTVYYDSAGYLYNQAIGVNATYPNPYLGLGEMQRVAGQYDAAKTTYFNAIKLIPGETNLYVGLAVLYIVTHKEDSAGYYFRKVLEIKPNAQAYGNYANYLALKGQDDSAIIFYDKAVALTTEDYAPLLNRGKILQKHNRWGEAQHDFEKAIKMSPEAGELYYVRSFCDTQKKDNALAIQDIEKAMSLGYKQANLDYYNSLKEKVAR